MKVVVKKQTELMNALLMNNSLVKKKCFINGCLDEQYTEKLNKFFNKATKTLNTQAKDIMSTLEKVATEFQNFVYYGKLDLFLCLDDNYNFDAEKYFNSNHPLANTAEQKEILTQFMNMVGEFARECNFDDFYNESKGYYDKQINIVKKAMSTPIQTKDIKSAYETVSQGKRLITAETKLNDFLSTLYGENTKTDDYTVNIIMSMANGGCFTSMDDEKYIVDSGNVRADGKASLIPAGDVGFVNYASHICHEISHNYVNPQTERLTDKETSSLCGFNANKYLEHDGYMTEYINESIIRAIQNVYSNSVVREYAVNVLGIDKSFIEKRIGQVNTEYFDTNKKRGFTCVGEIQQRIEETFSKEYNDFGERYKDIANVIMPGIECNNVFEDKMLINSEA